MIAGFNLARTNRLIGNNRKNINLLVGTVYGHGKLKRHLLPMRVAFLVCKFNKESAVKDQEEGENGSVLTGLRFSFFWSILLHLDNLLWMTRSQLLQNIL